MKKNECFTTTLEKGEVDLYRKDDFRLHVYKTRDPLGDICLILEKDRRALLIEPPCFFDNLKEVDAYLAKQGIKAEGLVLAYHMTGSQFVRGARRYSTPNAVNYGTRGHGKEMVENFARTFGGAFDAAFNEVTDYIEGDALEAAGWSLRVLPTAEAFDIEIPGFNARYLHMLGHDVHSIIASTAQLDGEVAKLEACLAKNYELVLSSHYPAEDLDDVREKIGYLKRLKSIAAETGSQEKFKAVMREEFPGYSGEPYLDMTAGFLFG